MALPHVLNSRLSYSLPLFCSSAFIFVHTKNTWSTLPKFPQGPFAGRAYNNAAESAGQGDHGFFKPKPRECDSLKASVEELNHEIQRLRDLQQAKLTELQNLQPLAVKMPTMELQAANQEQLLSVANERSLEPDDSPTDLASLSRHEHPWPQWTAFLKHLVNSGYFEDSGLYIDAENELFNEVSILKHALYRFGRDRDDIFRSLSTRDLKKVASFGCGNTDRKAVNSAKRLRMFCNIAEDDVCLKCRLKNSCARSFLQPASNLGAGTLDVVRVLFPYAVNTLPNAPLYELYPEDLTRSICSLLKQLLLLSANPKNSSFAPDSPRVVKEKVVVSKIGGLECANLSYRSPNLTQNTARSKSEAECTPFEEKVGSKSEEVPRRVNFQEDNKVDKRCDDNSKSRPYSRWEDTGYMHPREETEVVTLNSRDKTEHSSNEQWKPNSRKKHEKQHNVSGYRRNKGVQGSKWDDKDKKQSREKGKKLKSSESYVRTGY